MGGIIMTINEKLNEFLYTHAQREAFKNGANWMLEKAADWIGDSVVFDKFGRPVDTENFRKAMEE